MKKFIERHLLLPKSSFFLLNTFMYSTYAFIPLFLKSKWGIDDSHYGFLIILTGFGFFGSMFWGLLAERFHKPSYFIIIGATLYLISNILLLIPNSTWINDPFEIPFFSSLKLGTKGFCYTSFLTSFGNFTSSALYPLIDGIILRILTNDARFSKQLYGRQRLFGVIGQNFVTILSGYFSDFFGFNGIFWVMSFFYFLFLFNVIYMMVAYPYINLNPNLTVKNFHEKKNMTEKDAVSDDDGVVVSDVVVSDVDDDGHSFSSNDGQSVIDDDDVVSDDAVSDDAVSDRSHVFSSDDDQSIIDGNKILNKEKKEPELAKCDDNTNTAALPFCKALKSLISCYDYLFFLLMIWITGTSRAIIGNYSSQYLVLALKCPFSTLSWTFSSRLISEVALFFLSSSLITNYGVHNVLLAGFITGVLRVYFYAILPSDKKYLFAVSLIELFKGINSACIVTGSVHYIKEICPHGTLFVALGCYNGVYTYLSNATSGVFGAILLHGSINDFKKMFLLTSYIAFFGALSFLVKTIVEGQRRQSNGR